MVYTMEDICRIAKQLDLTTARKSKEGLIREIQFVEGSFDCFGTAGDHCDQAECAWREMCFTQER